MKVDICQPRSTGSRGGLQGRGQRGENPQMIARWLWSMLGVGYVLGHSVIFDSATLWTVARQDPLFMGVSRQEYWSRLPFASTGHLSNPGIEPMSPAAPALAGRFLTSGLPGKPRDWVAFHYCWLGICIIETILDLVAALW